VDAASNCRSAINEHSSRCRYTCRAGCLHPRAEAGQGLATLLSVNMPQLPGNSPLSRLLNITPDVLRLRFVRLPREMSLLSHFTGVSLPAGILACLPAGIMACLPAGIMACLPAGIMAGSAPLWCKSFFLFNLQSTGGGQVRQRRTSLQSKGPHL
jgi:hypothetical protein